MSHQRSSAQHDPAEAYTKPQPTLSPHAAADKILREISASLKPGPDAFTSGLDARSAIINLQGHNDQQQKVLEALATEMNDQALMNSLGLTGSVDRGKNGAITALNFANPDTVDAYKIEYGQLRADGYPRKVVQEIIAYSQSNGSYDHTGSMHLEVNVRPPSVSSGVGEKRWNGL